MKIVQIGEYVCKIGEGAQENWDLVGGAKKHHYFFHLTDFPSPYVVLECDRDGPNAHILERCAQVCVEHSKQKNAGKVKVDATPCGNVKVDKRDVVGECDYKNEGKVEIIVVQTTKKNAGAQDEEEKQASGYEKTEEGTRKAPSKGKAKAKSAGGKEKIAAEIAMAEGKHVAIRKNVIGGWATVTFTDAAVRNALLRETTEIAIKSGVVVKLQAQVDQNTKEEVPTEIFASWGRKAEEKTPVSEAELLRCFDELASRYAAAVQRAAPVVATGMRVTVRKAAVGGCAVVSFIEPELRARVLETLGREITLESGIAGKLQAQVDPKTKAEVPTDVFVAWGRKVEEKTPVSEEELLRFFDNATEDLETSKATDAAN